jgi:hypothetical protein
MPVWEHIHDHLLLPVVNLALPTKVSDIWLQGTRSWNLQLLSTTFFEEFVQEIQATPVVNQDREDILRWVLAKNGHYTTKSSYTFLANKQLHRLTPPS